MANEELGSGSIRLWGTVYHSASSTVPGPTEQITIPEKDRAAKRRNCLEREGAIPMRTKCLVLGSAGQRWFLRWVQPKAPPASLPAEGGQWSPQGSSW